MKTFHAMPFGATVLDNDHGVRFALWAPGIEQLNLALGPDDTSRTLPMPRDIDGWHRLDVPEARPGDDYRFVLPDGLRVPDPASRFNPGDVHGASRVVDPKAFRWSDDAWRGRPWEEAVVYELHVGAFTPEGSFAAAERRLPELAELGITAVELMPLADFPGHRGWGYDGVLLFAPDSSYGTPDELKSLVDAAHALGIMMFIDVVYNHFGPEGNYLHAYCPQFFNAAVQTPWGSAINYDGPYSRTVRDFVIHNALYWVEEFHFDGLRMDAIHAISDQSDTHVVTEICQALRSGPGAERALHIVLENEHNQAGSLARDIDGNPRVATAQWNDDIHHAVHVFSTGETDGYYADFAEAPVRSFAIALAQGFVYQGQPSLLRDGEPRGEPTSDLPLGAFVSFLQTHDQIGNRAFGDRIHAIADPVLLKAAYACVMLSPHVPMLFMGEEYAASTPFQYFCEFGPELADAVSNGRRAEFGRFAVFADEAARERIPDPNAASTFEASKLKWDERKLAPHDAWLAQTRELLDVRRRLITPRLAGGWSSGRYEIGDGDTIRIGWSLGAARGRVARDQLHLIAHFGAGPVAGIPVPPGSPIHSFGAEVETASKTLRLERGAFYLSLLESELG